MVKVSVYLVLRREELYIPEDFQCSVSIFFLERNIKLLMSQEIALFLVLFTERFYIFFRIKKKNVYEYFEALYI